MKEQGEASDAIHAVEALFTWDNSVVVFESQEGHPIHNVGAVCKFLIEELGVTEVRVEECVQDGSMGSHKRFTAEWDHSKTDKRPIADFPDPN